MRVFADRQDAGRALAEKLATYEGRDRRGRPRASPGRRGRGLEVAKALRAPLDVYVVRKLGVPGQEELAFGAIASGDVRVLNHDVVQAAGLSQAESSPSPPGSAGSWSAASASIAGTSLRWT